MREQHAIGNTMKRLFLLIFLLLLFSYKRRFFSSPGSPTVRLPVQPFRPPPTATQSPTRTIRDAREEGHAFSRWPFFISLSWPLIPATNARAHLRATIPLYRLMYTRRTPHYHSSGISRISGFFPSFKFVYVYIRFSFAHPTHTRS